MRRNGTLVCRPVGRRNIWSGGMRDMAVPIEAIGWFLDKALSRVHPRQEASRAISCQCIGQTVAVEVAKQNAARALRNAQIRVV